MDPNVIVNERKVGPQVLITQRPTPQLLVLAAGGNRAELLHSLTAPIRVRALGTARLAHLATATYCLMYGLDGSIALQVVDDDTVDRAYSRGTAQTGTAQKTGLLGYSTLDTSTPMYHVQLAAMLPRLGLVNLDGSDGPVLRHLRHSSWMSPTAITASPPTMVATIALIGLVCEGLDPKADMSDKIVARCAHGAKTFRCVFGGFITITEDGTFYYDEANCFLVRLSVTMQANYFAALASQTVASSQLAFDVLHPAASTRTDALALAALYPGLAAARVVDRSAAPSWYTTSEALVDATVHLNDAQKVSALADLGGAYAAWRGRVDDPTALWRSDATCEIYLQLCDSTTYAREGPWVKVIYQSLTSLGLSAPRACTAAKLALLDINDKPGANRSLARATARHLLSLFRGTNLWLFHLMAFALWERGGVFPVDGLGRVRLPHRLEEPSDLVRLARLLAQVLELLQMDARTTLDGDIDCVTLMHGLGYRSVVAYDGRVSEATLNQRTLAALFQWSPVPATVSNMATLDLVATYGASVVETDIPA